MHTRDVDRAGEVQPAGAEVRAWDVPTRLFHWALVVGLALAWVSRMYGDDGLVWHTWNGCAILVLVVWRVLWGFVGSSTARFSSFFYWPWAALKYGLDFALRRPRHFLGHNPLGAGVVLALLALVGSMGVLGLFAYEDRDLNVGGPLSGRVPDWAWAAAAKWHVYLFNTVLLGLIALHVAANVLYLVWKRENLIKAMITGRKPADHYEDQQEMVVVGSGRALLCFVAIAVVFGGILLAGGKLPNLR